MSEDILDRIICEAENCIHNCGTRCENKSIVIGKNKKCQNYEKVKVDWLMRLVLPEKIAENIAKVIK